MSKLTKAEYEVEVREALAEVNSGRMGAAEFVLVVDSLLYLFTGGIMVMMAKGETGRRHTLKVNAWLTRRDLFDRMVRMLAK